ncbi:MAG: hypothetical protein AAB922_05650 [Patescibacteria group bacterium]
MSITQHGPVCDVCGEYILLDPHLERFSVNGIERELHSHTRCRPAVETMSAAQDYRLLPPGPLRRAYEEADAAGLLRGGAELRRKEGR